MISDSELNRMKMRAEHILAMGRKVSQDSLVYHVLRGDAIDVITLIEEIEDLKRQFYKLRRTDFKIVTTEEIQTLLNKGDNSDVK